MPSQDSRQSELFRQVFESTVVPVAMFDRDMRYIKASRRYLSDYCLNAENIIGRSFYDVFPELPQDWKEVHRRCLAGATERLEGHIVHPDGETVSTHWEFQPWYGVEGQIDGILLFSEIIPANLQPQPSPRTHEEQYLLIFQSNPQPMWIYDLETLRFLNVNNAAIQKYGYTYDEFLQMTIKDIRPKDDIPSLLENIGNVTNGLDIAGSWRHLKKDGSLIDVDITSHTLTFNGRPSELVMAQDITRRKKLETELIAQKDLLEKILKNIPVMICTINQTGQISFANKEFLRVLDTTLDEVQAHPDMFSVWYPDPEYRAQVMEFIQKSEGKFAEFFTHNGSGKVIPISFANVLLQDGTSIGIGLDITERKQSESERDLLLKAIEQAAEIIMVTDPDGFIEYVNPAFETVTGYNREEILGKSSDLLRSEELEDDEYRDMWADLTRGKTWRGRFANKRKDGSLYTEDACISPVTDSQGRITNFVATKHDITQQIALEQQYLQAQKMESVGQLAGGIAHDFNNLLSLIIGRAELRMRKLEASDESHKALYEIQKAAQRSAKLTQQLLTFARKQTIAPQVIDLNNCVESTLQMLQSLIGENLDLVWIPETSLWPIEIDPAQLDQILTNLTLNARDSIVDIGKITIESSMVTFDQAYCNRHAGFMPGDFAKLEISDDGVGMDRKTRERIFEPFFTTKSLGEGTGLGLSTVYGIVKQNNGFINVYSEPGQGTTFSIYFPRIHGEAKTVVIDKASTAQDGQGQAILLVEDDASLLKLSEELLSELGYRVFSAESPAAAIQIATTDTINIDLLITDVVMPGMNGKELAETLLKSRPELKVLFISGYTANVIAHQGILDAEVNFLQKPLSIDILAKKLLEIFR